MVPLPDSKVVVFGPKWDKYNLTPWVYDVKENTWSNKLTPDGKTLPPLPEEKNHGRSVLIENKVCFFRDYQVLILDLSTLEEWEVIRLAQDHCNFPVLAPFSPTEVAIVGGNFNAPHNNISIFDSQTERSRILSPQTDDLGVLSHHSAVVVSGQLAFAQTTDKELKFSLSEIILKGSSVTYKTIRLVAESEDKAETLERLDLNQALKLTGHKELTAPQLELFEDWWNRFLDYVG